MIDFADDIFLEILEESREVLESSETFVNSAGNETEGIHRIQEIIECTMWDLQVIFLIKGDIDIKESPEPIEEEIEKSPVNHKNPAEDLEEEKQDLEFCNLLKGIAEMKKTYLY